LRGQPGVKALTCVFSRNGVRAQVHG
jgi:hypothetical protein